jgi:uncharacterized protein (TIGR02001 family)
MIKSRIAAGAALLAVAGAAQAGTFSVTPTITNDYDFRGFTQSDENFAAQLGATYAFDSGFYVGAWGSNVDYGDTGIEVDYFAGYAGSTESFGYDFGANFYTYSGYDNASDGNTLEFYAGISKDWLSGKLWFSDDLGGSGESSFYVEGNAGYPLAAVEGLSLIGHVGYGFGDAFDGVVYAEEVLDYAAGLGYSYNNFNLAVKYVDTDVSGSDGRVVATLSTTLPWSE